jgi:hypothetical protein
MSVVFQNVHFQNITGINMSVDIEIPPGTVVVTRAVPASETVTIPVLRDSCLSVRIAVSDRDHGAKQDFILSSPGSGGTSYIELIDVQFSPGNIVGTVTARTD